MNKQNLKKYLPDFVINYRRFILRKLRRFKKYLHNNGRPFFYRVESQNESFYIQINPFKNGCVDEMIELEGYWEPELLSALKKLIKNGDVFLDIGANIGYHSIAIASAFPETKVMSFEPQESLCNQIRSSISENNLNNVTVYQVGLSDVVQEALIHIPEENVGGSSIIKGLNNHPAFKKSTKIKLETLDSFLPVLPNVSVIKIDVEGLEPEVLKGGLCLIKKYHPVIVMEFSPIIYQHINPKITHSLIELLGTLGYEFFDTKFNSLDLTRWVNEADHLKKGQIDIVCMPKK